MGNKDNDDPGHWRNPNAEDCVLQPGEKRVRFSFCEPIVPVDHFNEGYENDETEDSGYTPEEMSHFQQVRTRRRDSVHPTMMDHDRRIMMDPDSDYEEKPDDPFEKIDTEEEASTPWSELSGREKLERIGIGVAKGLALITLLYFFVCSLDLLSKGFRLIGGRTAGEIFQQSDILQNPVVGVMIGILTTVLVQSSSTSTSIIVGMVAAGFMDVKLAIPLIMGSNIGTSITNTIVSFMQAGDKEQFRKAFAGATILDMFNWITVIVLLIVEVLTGYLYHVSKAWVDVMVPDPDAMGEIKLLSALTEPFVNLIVQLDESVLECWSNPNCTEGINDSLIKQKCRTSTARIEITERLYDKNGKLESTLNGSKEFIFAGTSLSDAAVGAIVLVGSLLVLCTCLILIVKLLSSVLRGHVSVVIKKVLNADIPYVPWITGYIAIFIGAVMTFLVQSSSVFTSALTPLVGLGVISLKRVYPLTLGANVGTTTTAVLASFAVEPKAFRPSMQIALCHLLFNVTGILLFYPIPYLRFPIHMAKFLGNMTAEYRWFAVLYMVMMFAVFPVVFIGLSFAGPIYVIVLVSLIGLVIVILVCINFAQNRFPRLLPPFLRSWQWVPLPLRSLKPYDDLFARLPCCAKCRKPEEEENEDKDKEFNYYRSHNAGPPWKTWSPKDSHGQLPRVIEGSEGNKDVSNGGESVMKSETGNHQPRANGYFGNDQSSDLNQRDNGYVKSRNGHNNGANGSSSDNSNSVSGNVEGFGSDNEGYQGSNESVIV